MSDEQKLFDESGCERDEGNVDTEEMEGESIDEGGGDCYDEDQGEEHEFEIIDQVESEEGEGEAEGDQNDKTQKEGGNNIYDDSSSGVELDDSELHAMLEIGIDKDTIKAEDRSVPIIKQKIVLKEFESDPFDILPEGWVCVTHNCGMPVYLHKESRVCTMARPYSLGSASARAHDIPLSAIPCLNYRKQLDKEAVKTKPVPEVGSSDKRPSEVSDAAETTPLEIQQSTVILESNTSPQLPKSACQNASICPAATPEPKQSQRKLWVVSQESFQKCPLESQKEALHTGTGFTTGDDHVTLFKDNTTNSSIMHPHSPGDDNIAVSLDTSSLENPCPDLSSQTSSMTMDASCRQTQSDFLHSQSTEDTLHSTYPNASFIENCNHSHPTMQPEKCTSEEVLCVDMKDNCKDELDGVEEGEIVDDDKTDNTCNMKSPEACYSTLPVTLTSDSVITPEVCVASASNLKENDHQDNIEVEINHQDNIDVEINHQDNIDVEINHQDNIDVEINHQDNIDVAKCKNNPTHLVREEVSSSLEPSELVTSSSNSLATIKRKIESLKNKRGGKMRKLDGSAVSWPTENNIAVSPHKMGIGDASNAALITNANEKLKMHAAEVKIKSAEERAKEYLLDSKTIHNYCLKLFQFRTLEVKKYRSWRERRRHIDERSRRNRPELPPSTKLITCPIPGNLRSEDGGENAKKREFILNPTGKSYLCILHEYMQRTLKIQPLYVFKELENSKTPYGATVMIGNIEYGIGYASSKKVAKQEAAKETLKVLIPDLFKKITDHEIKRNISDLSFFDEIKVTDPRVNDLGNKVGQPSPFQLLLECLRRNFGMGNTQCIVSTKPLKNQKCEFTINVGKHSAMVVAKNKREGKQLAAQAILSKLHPHVPSWGSLLRLYGTNVEKPAQKPEEITDIKIHAPNNSVLENLRAEMRKLHQQKKAIQPKGRIFINSRNLPSKMSGVDL